MRSAPATAKDGVHGHDRRRTPSSPDRIPGERHQHAGHVGEDGQVINAIKSTVPDEMWEEIGAKLDEPIAVGPPADELEERDDAEDEYDLVDPAMADETGWNPCIAPALALTRRG
jgi:hypothetical protein